MAVILRTRATLNYGSGGPGLFTAYWAPGTVGGSTADATDCVARVRAGWQAWRNNLPSTYTAVFQTDVAALEATTGVLTGLFSATPPADVTGAGGVLQAPTAAMGLLRLRTNVIISGRLLRGRWFVGPLSQACVDGFGNLTAGNLANFNTGGAAILAAGATTSALAVWHRPTPTTAGGHALVSSISTWNEIAVLRSRRDA